MATAARKTGSVYDYPEHLNPFRDEDNHSKIRFWTLGRRLSRTNSISFSNIKTDLKNSWAFRSFMKKGKKGHSPANEKNAQVNGECSSPIIYRRAMQYSSTSGDPYNSIRTRTTVGPDKPNQYVYGGSVTPLPRSRFQERLRSTSNYEVNSLRYGGSRVANSDITGSRLSIESTNPFDEDDPVPPIRAPRRKKKKAPLPPSEIANSTVTSFETTLDTSKETDESKIDLETRTESLTEENPLKIELQIVEDEDIINHNTTKEQEKFTIEETNKDRVPDEIQANEISVEVKAETPSSDSKPQVIEPIVEIRKKSFKEDAKRCSSEGDILNKISFQKIDIDTYRRNSNLNEEDVELRKKFNRCNGATDNMRSKSLNEKLNLNFVTYDINLNEDTNVTNNNIPEKVICKLYDNSITRKNSANISVSSADRDLLEIDRATRELEKEISKLNSALLEDEDDFVIGSRVSVSAMRKRFDDNRTPNPIPKPKRNLNGSISPINK